MIFLKIKIFLVSSFKRKISFCVCASVLILYGCAPSPYKIIGDAENANNGFKYILLSDRYTNRAGVMLDLINESNWARFDEELKYVTDVKVKNFLTAIRLLKENKAAEAHHLLARLDEAEFDCQVKVLKVDCLSNLKVDSVDFRKKYQEAFDCTTDPTVKIISKTLPLSPI
jgi:hypothetical protein